jgi:hypothetical protein
VESEFHRVLEELNPLFIGMNGIKGMNQAAGKLRGRLPKVALKGRHGLPGAIAVNGIKEISKNTE